MSKNFRLPHYLTLLIAFFFAAITNAQLPNGVTPGSNWSDSYQANGLCWCETTFDHDLDDINKVWFVINGERRNIRDICEELAYHPSFRKRQSGDYVYNDVQCGNGPANTAIDEVYCPGQVGISSRNHDDLNDACQTKGPKWDLSWLASRARFDGDEEETEETAEDQIIDNGTYYLSSPYLDQNLVSTAALNHNAQMEDAAEVSRQQWTFTHLGKNVYTIKNKNSNRFLEVPKAQCYNNANVATWIGSNSSHHRWQISKNGNHFVLKATHCATNALDREKGAKDANVSIYPYYNGNNNQKWEINKNTTTSNPDNGSGTKVVTLMGETIKKYITIQNNTTQSVICNQSNISSNAQFTMEALDNGNYAFKGNNGKYLSSENALRPASCNRSAARPWEQFSLISLGGDVYAFYCIYGGYLSHENGTKAMNWNRSKIGPWERFVISEVNGSKIAPIKATSTTFTAFPNPITADDVLSIQLNLEQDTDVVIQLIDIQGRKIAQQHFEQLLSGKNFIELGELQQSIPNKGIYILSIKSDFHSVNTRIVFTD